MTFRSQIDLGASSPLARSVSPGTLPGSHPRLRDARSLLALIPPAGARGPRKGLEGSRPAPLTPPPSAFHLGGGGLPELPAQRAPVTPAPARWGTRSCWPGNTRITVSTSRNGGGGSGGGVFDPRNVSIFGKGPETWPPLAHTPTHFWSRQPNKSCLQLQRERFKEGSGKKRNFPPPPPSSLSLPRAPKASGFCIPKEGCGEGGAGGGCFTSLTLQSKSRKAPTLPPGCRALWGTWSYFVVLRCHIATQGLVGLLRKLPFSLQGVERRN